MYEGVIAVHAKTGLIILFITVIDCLTMEGIVVPPYIFEGESTEMRCLFRLDQDSLYSVTWYKDHEEFYRYVPRDNPKQHTYRLEGADVDQLRSGVHAVKLKAATSAASGVYRCEVSAEAPSFTSAHAEKRMEVVSLSDAGPKITGEVYTKDYKEGDILALNCTAGKSHPPARIKWFVNDRQVASCFEILVVSDGSSISGLCMRLSRGHFRRGLLTVRCEATVGVELPLFDKKEASISVYGSARTNKTTWTIFSLTVIIVYMFSLQLRM